MLINTLALFSSHWLYRHCAHALPVGIAISWLPLLGFALPYLNILLNYWYTYCQIYVFSYDLHSNTHYGFSSSHARNVLMTLSLVMLIICVITWFLWMLVSACKAQNELRKLPYLATRFRQLSFRFFVLQTSFVILYQIFLLALQWGQSGLGSVNIGLNRTGFLSTVIITTVYIWLVAFVYLPVHTTNISATFSNKEDDAANQQTKEHGKLNVRSFAIVHSGVWSLLISLAFALRMVRCWFLSVFLFAYSTCVMRVIVASIFHPATQRPV